MHYSSHPPCAFHNRIARYLGVLVGAALVATLGLPSAAQAQTPAAPTVNASGDGETAGGAINLIWGAAPGKDASGTKIDGWRVEYKEPGEDAVAVYLAVKENTLKEALEADDPRIHHGVWQFRVSYWPIATAPTGDEDEAPEHLGAPSAWVSYQHGPPTDAPTGLMAHPAGPDARRLVWDEATGITYALRYTADATDGDAWTEWEDVESGTVVDGLTMGATYTFELRPSGETRAGIGDLHGPSASTKEMMPVPTPTLPEIAALFLAMLLLGSGAYLLRRRQSGGLTPA